jgi:hypothetical protein
MFTAMCCRISSEMRRDALRRYCIENEPTDKVGDQMLINWWTEAQERSNSRRIEPFISRPW